MAPKIQEAIVAAHAGDAEHRFPDPGYHGLGLGSERTAARRRGGNHPSKLPPVHLAGSPRGQAIEYHDLVGDHVRRQLQPDGFAYRGGGDPVRILRRHEADQAVALMHDDRCLAYTPYAPEHSLDFLQLHPMPADLDLEILPAQEGELAIRQPADRIAGPVEACSGHRGE